MEGRRVSESASEYSELALPNDANGLGNLLGGKIMHVVGSRRRYRGDEALPQPHCHRRDRSHGFHSPGQDRPMGAASLERQSRFSHLDGDRRESLGAGSRSMAANSTFRRRT